MRAILSTCVLSLWLSTPVLADNWDFYATTPEQLAPMIGECVGARDKTSEWKECVGLFVEPCVSERPDFRRCFDIEAGAWKVVLKEEFKMTLIDAILRDEKSTEAKPYHKRRAESLCRAQAAWEKFLNAECDSQRAISGAGTIGKDYAAACLHSEISERTLSVRRTRALILAQGDADLEIHREHIKLSSAELRGIYGRWCDLSAGAMK